MVLSKNNQAILTAHKKGYKVDTDGNVFYKNRKLKLSKTSYGYPRFGVRTRINGENKMRHICVHRFQAYQKYGEIIFVDGIQVRHLNNIKEDCSYKNIAVGTQKQNMQDRSPENRLKHAIYASSFIKKHNHSKVIAAYKAGKSYSQIMKEFNISSKGTVHFIVKKSMSCS